MDSVKILNQYIDDHAALYNADTAEAITMFGNESVDIEVYSPPIFQPLHLFQQ
jgi:hypothetical protein